MRLGSSRTVLERQVEIHSEEVASRTRDRTRLEQSVTVAQGQLTDAQSAVVMKKGKCTEYRRRLGI